MATHRRAQAFETSASGKAARTAIAAAKKRVESSSSRDEAIARDVSSAVMMDMPANQNR